MHHGPKMGSREEDEYRDSLTYYEKEMDLVIENSIDPRDDDEDENPSDNDED